MSNIILRPHKTIVTTGQNAIVSVSDVRDDLGLFDDTTSDTRVERALETAHELVSIAVNKPIASTTITDFYPCVEKRFELSKTPAGSTIISLSYYDVSDTKQQIAELTHTETPTDVALYDESQNVFTLKGEVGEYEYSQDRLYPVVLEYSSSPFVNYRLSLIQQAIIKCTYLQFDTPDPVLYATTMKQYNDLIHVIKFSGGVIGAPIEERKE